MDILKFNGSTVVLKCDCGCIFISNLQAETNTVRRFMKELDGELVRPICPTCKSVIDINYLWKSGIEELQVIRDENLASDGIQ